MRRGFLACLLLGGLIAAAPAATGAEHGRGSIRVGLISQQTGPTSAIVGASITTGGNQTSDSGGGTTIAGSANGSGGAPAPPPYPLLASDSPLLQDGEPYGSGSFWYPNTTGQTCAYIPDSSPLCFNVTGSTAPAIVTPAAIAEDLVAELDLSAGAIAASPAPAGITGAASWFWLDPTPSEQDLSETLAGETVTISAVPSVSWQFGDGSSTAGSAGVPYQPEPPPPAAVTHTYQTRCLPGDQGTDPYVLPSCGPAGYTLTASVSWQISYQATGPDPETGTLPTRTTSSTISYPVSEVRGFLTGPATP